MLCLHTNDPSPKAGYLAPGSENTFTSQNLQATFEHKECTALPFWLALCLPPQKTSLPAHLSFGSQARHGSRPPLALQTRLVLSVGESGADFPHFHHLIQIKKQFQEQECKCQL